MFSVSKLLGIGCTVAVSSIFADVQRPNVLVIFADDLGYGDVGCYGATKLETPEIDRLAENGTLFTNAYAPSSTCSQSRVSLLTGRYWWRSPLHPSKGVIAPAGPNALLEPGVEALPKFSKRMATARRHSANGTSAWAMARLTRNALIGAALGLKGGRWNPVLTISSVWQRMLPMSRPSILKTTTLLGVGQTTKLSLRGKRDSVDPEVLYKEDEVGQDTTVEAVSISNRHRRISHCSCISRRPFRTSRSPLRSSLSAAVNVVSMVTLC